MIKETVELAVTGDLYNFVANSISFVNISKNEVGKATHMTMPKKAVEMIVDAFLAQNPGYGMKEEIIETGIGTENETKTKKGKNR
jgi:hypothetical protein